MFKINALYRTDGYKIGHKLMLAPNTDFLYGTWIPRSVKYSLPGITKVVSFGQQLTWKWLHDEFEENFFKLPKEEAVDKFARDMAGYLALPFNAEHFKALHDVGYLPVKVKSLPEGVETLPNIPHMTFKNTIKGFAWLPLYLETIISSLAWKPSTSATIALQYKRNFTEWVLRTDPSNAFLIPFLGHDFSARGLSPWDMISSGLGHATSFIGSDTLPVIEAARYFYGVPDNEVCIASVPASEHSVSTTCIFTMGEQEMIKYYMEQFPNGILSIVSDTFDLWKLITVYIASLAKDILNRNGKVVIRPDSGDPVKIITGYTRDEVFIDEETNDIFLKVPCDKKENELGYIRGRKISEAEYKGVIELLWDIFGGVINEEGYKVLDSHIGAIYGDSITTERQIKIFERLAQKGFASTNIVLGIGSFTYQFNTRDTQGFAAKGGYVEIEGQGYALYKDPVTDDGTKKSPRGLLRVDLVDNEYVLRQNCTPEEENGGELHTIYENGEFKNIQTLSEIRLRIDDLANK